MKTSSSELRPIDPPYIGDGEVGDGLIVVFDNDFGGGDYAFAIEPLTNCRS